jgi:hypothetical protein
VDGRLNRLSICSNPCLNFQCDVYGHGYDERLYRHGSSYSDGESKSNGRRQLPDDLQRLHSHFNRHRRYNLYMDRRLNRLSKCNDSGINNNDNLYGNRYAERLYSNSGSHGNGHAASECTGELTGNL